MYAIVRIVFVIAAALLSTVGLDFSQQGDPAESKRYVVESGDFYFDPPGLLIQPGDTVEWVFVEITVDGHTTTAYHPTYKKELRMPENAIPWDSDLVLEKDKSFAVRLDTVGIYDYFCLFHEFLGMIGRIIVQEPTGPVSAKPAVSGLPPAAQQAMPAIDEIMGSIGRLFNFAGELNYVLHLSRQKDPKKALARFDRFLAEFKSGAGHANSVLEILKRVNLSMEIENALQELGNLLKKEAAFEEIEKLAKTMKTYLSEARKRLKTG